MGALAVIAGIAVAVCIVCFLIIVGQAGQSSPFKNKVQTVASAAGIVLIICLLAWCQSPTGKAIKTTNGVTAPSPTSTVVYQEYPAPTKAP
jgi:hypothetical protein